ncbi:hypothetical protein BDV98DRAFT_562162 [Pterulicium gracile]|uniref:Uncharacterized protein n=1 Tax=Pterulicium gracile TaxID=1884261 RepID=A0A5C3QR91_9AGAR|nr:hypothetical protein BDV98DRAFT_562162 [Pterula gracilis]
MVVLLQAVIDTMRTSSTAQHKPRQQKQQRQKIGLGSRPLSKLVLWAAHHPKIIMEFRWRTSGEEPYNREDDRTALYCHLKGLLGKYADLDPLKKKGACFPTVQFTNLKGVGNWVYREADELFTVTGELLLDKRVWDPVEN